jgi:glycosyltransferase involved in cell wall biosynthesis
MDNSPIIIFAYNRPQHLEKSLLSLKNNPLSSDSELYIFCDGYKANASDKDIQLIEATRAIAKSQAWCKKVEIIEADQNKGLAQSVIDGITKILETYDKVIVLEDDILLSDGFLNYMNEALNLYEGEDQVMHISAYFLPVDDYDLEETFFYNTTSCWGWGTWSRAWKNMISDPQVLIDKLNSSEKLLKGFHEKKYNPGNYQSLLANASKKINTWAVLWHTSVYLKGGLSLHPRKSLVRNIGHDNSGDNCKHNDSLMNQAMTNFIRVNKIKKLKESKLANRLAAEYYYTRPSYQKIIRYYIQRIYQFLKL